MKKIGFTKLYLLVCICLVSSLHAQQHETSPDRPILEFVTVDPLTGHITIVWDMPSPQISPIDVEEFVLFWYEQHPAEPGHPTSTARPFASFNDLDMVPPYSYTFDYDTIVQREPMMPDPRKSSVAFAVSAVNHSPFSTSLRAYEDYNVHLTHFYDSCKTTLRFDWTPYIGWLENTEPLQPLINYRVMRILEGGGAEEVETVSDRTTSYLIDPVETNKIHTYYIEAVRADGVTSTSFRTITNTYMPSSPSYIEALHTNYNDLNHPEVTFRIDPAAQTHGYLLYGTSNPNFPFVPIEEFTIYQDTTLTHSYNHGKSYYYRLDALHICKGENHILSSNVATAIWLSINQDGLLNYLSWDPYQQWNDIDDIAYDVYRKVGENVEEIISTIAGEEQTVRVDDLTGQGVDETVCYWIMATPVELRSSNRYAISNTVCIIPESDIYIPRAFIPNSIDQNNEYKPTFTFPPYSDYLMTLFDRTGAKVFETTNYEMGWNGQLMNRKPASEGVYTYFIRYRTAAGKTVLKRGTFVLVMP